MKTAQRTTWGAMISLVLGTATAHAGEPGFYVGGQYGKLSKDEDPATLDALTLGIYDELDHVSDVRSGTFDSDDTAWGFFAGYQLLRNLAFEGGYLSIGKDVLRQTSSGVFAGTGAQEIVTTSLGVRTTGFAISALGTWPISYNWEVYARAGVLFATNTLSLYLATPEGSFATEFDDSSTDWLAGAGVSYLLAEVYQLRAEYSRVFDAGTKDYGEGDVDLLTVGITVRF